MAAVGDAKDTERLASAFLHRLAGTADKVDERFPDGTGTGDEQVDRVDGCSLEEFPVNGEKRRVLDAFFYVGLDAALRAANLLRGNALSPENLLQPCRRIVDGSSVLSGGHACRV